ncbi:MAG: DUF1553 domain-containing protein [Gemmataceae bacterium]|nr:DUF1553 domain-containing protein [Gemmataceae bacterium]
MRKQAYVVALIAVALALPCPVQAQPKNSKGIEFFEAKIRPVLATHCYECHSAKSTKVKGGLLLDTKAGVLAGGDDGPVVVLGKSNSSSLIKALRHDGPSKMPKNKLPDSVIQDFVEWIAMGAPDPREGQAATKGYKTMTLEDAKSFWAFQPPKKTEPSVKNGAWAKAPIDRFLLARMETKGLKPVADADRYTLLRRVHFDLVGLPPTVDEIETFINDKSADAVEKLVDRLLASKHFGERWGRHWLDIARYAETNGNADNVPFPQAYRYRDYVIDAVNRDTPYDRFIMEQIAGDLLPAANAKEKDNNLTATGFLALTSKPRAQNNPDFKFDLIADQIDVTTRAVLAMSVMCARCHDHKFDPISTKDYYAMAGIFDSSIMLFGNNAGKKGGKATGYHALSDGGEAMGIRDAVNAVDCSVLVRGDAKQPSVKVPRGFPTALVQEWTPKLNRAKSGRLEMAQWLTAKENPLTARVAVNRIWMHLFGQGLVRSPDNFGSLGETPTHPELLDYLAIRFIENGWSTKKMIKEIMLTRAYQISGKHDETNYKIDPDTMMVWRMPTRRLEAEAIRDAVLTVSGKLNREPLKGSMVGQLPKKKKGIGTASDDSNHRSIYLAMVRGAPLPEILALFDIANPNLVVAQREVTTVPAQALFMINSPFANAHAKSFAQRLEAYSSLDDAGKINLAYLIALGRPASDADRTRSLNFLREAGKAGESQAWASFCQTLLASAEFRYVQ